MTKWQRYVGLTAALGVSVVALSLTDAGQVFAQGALKPLSALIVNDASRPVPVVASELFPTPFQAHLTFNGGSGNEECVNVPAGYGLIVELVTARTFSDAKTANFIMTMETVAGGVRVGHDMAFERLDTNVGVALTLTQALRAYADPGDETLCFGSGNFSSGPYVGVQVSFSGQLVPLQ